MRNITENIENAIHKNIPWSVLVFSEFIGQIEVVEKNVEASFWEDEENWAIVMLKKEILMYVWKKYPHLAQVLWVWLRGVGDLCPLKDL